MTKYQRKQQRQYRFFRWLTVQDMFWLPQSLRWWAFRRAAWAHLKMNPGPRWNNSAFSLEALAETLATEIQRVKDVRPTLGEMISDE